MNISDIRNKLNTVGNIEVIFVPSQSFEKNLISKARLKDILEKSSVSLRGWSFPHIPNQDKENTKRPYTFESGLEFFTDWNKFTEMFRFYQSGQFLARLALLEDTIGRVNNKEFKPGEYLDFISTIYKLTEIIIFIRNLLENTGVDRGELTIKINKTRDRKLQTIFSYNIIPFWQDYICNINSVTISREIDREMLSDHLSVSRTFIKETFEYFNCFDVSDHVIKTHQENLINRRI